MRTIDERVENKLPVLLDEVVDVTKDTAVKWLIIVSSIVGLSNSPHGRSVAKSNFTELVCRVVTVSYFNSMNSGCSGVVWRSPKDREFSVCNEG